MKKKIKKIIAWSVIVILGLLYLTTLILALCGSTLQSGLFMACLYLTIVLPVLAFVVIWLFDRFTGRPGPGDKELPAEGAPEEDSPEESPEEEIPEE